MGGDLRYLLLKADLEDRDDGVVEVVLAPGDLASSHLEDSAPEGPDVGGEAVVGLGDDLAKRRQVKRGGSPALTSGGIHGILPLSCWMAFLSLVRKSVMVFSICKLHPKSAILTTPSESTSTFEPLMSRCTILFE